MKISNEKILLTEKNTLSSLMDVMNNIKNKIKQYMTRILCDLRKSFNKFTRIFLYKKNNQIVARKLYYFIISISSITYKKIMYNNQQIILLQEREKKNQELTKQLVEAKKKLKNAEESQNLQEIIKSLKNVLKIQIEIKNFIDSENKALQTDIQNFSLKKKNSKDIKEIKDLVEKNQKLSQGFSKDIDHLKNTINQLENNFSKENPCEPYDFVDHLNKLNLNK